MPDGPSRHRPAHEELLSEMNPYFLETEMRLRPAELQREIEGSRRLADLLAALLWTLYPIRRPSTERLDVTGAAEPGPA